MAETNKGKVAYIDSSTVELSLTDEYVEEASKLLLAEAKKIMNLVKDNGITLTSSTADGKTYDSKACISVQPLPTKEDAANQLYSLKVAIPIDKQRLTLYAKNDISNGVIFQKIEGLIFNNGKAERVYGNDISRTDYSENLKAAANVILRNGFVKENLKNLSYEANQYFASFSDKVEVKIDGGYTKFVNNAYAKYMNDDKGERVQFRSHDNNVVVDIGYREDGSRFAYARNYDITSEGKPIEWDSEGKAILGEGEQFAFAPINEPKDLALIGNELIAIEVAEFKGIDMPEYDKGRTWGDVIKGDISRDATLGNSSLAFIHKDTKELAKTDEFVNSASYLMLSEATDIMTALKQIEADNGEKLLAPVDKNGQAYDAKAIIQVQPYKDGKYSLTVSIPVVKNEYIKLYAKNDISDGLEFHTVEATLFKDKTAIKASNDEISADKGFADSTLSVAKYLNDNVIKPYEKSALMQMAIDTNNYLKENSGMVQSFQTDKQVPDAYAKYHNDNYGERIRIHSHTDNNLVVELGWEMNGGKPYAVILDFNKTDENGSPEKTVVRSSANLDKIRNSAVKECVSNWTDIQPLKETSSPTVAKDNSGKDSKETRVTDDEYPF